MEIGSRSPIRTVLVAKGVGIFILANLLLLYVPITAIGLGTLLLVAGGCLFLDHKNLIVLVCALVGLTMALELAARWVSPSSMKPYYRPHEILALEKTYRPSETVQMDVQHGDLLATDPLLPRDLAQPRQEVFTTDSLGYRNTGEYAGERLFIVGDSFVAGIGNTQEDTLTSQLRRDFGIHAYNLGFPSGPQGYAERVKWARSKFSENSCIAVVFFEGNDFQLTESAEVAARSAVPKEFQLFAKSYIQVVRGHSEFSRVFYGLTTRAWEIIHERQKARSAGAGERSLPQAITFVKTIDGQPMGFLRGYAEVVQRQIFDDHGFIQEKLSEAKPDLILFVPDKYRVYSGLFDEEALASLPNVQWDYLLSVANKLGVPAFNLTDKLIEHARQILPGGGTIYWRDDTHWNREGITVGAKQLVEAGRSMQNERCRSVFNGE